MQTSIYAYIPILVSALGTTVWLSWLALAIGTIGGLLLALMATSRFRLLRIANLLYSQFFVSVPILIVLFFFYYGASRLLDLDISSFTAATAALAAHASALLSSIIAAGIGSVKRGQSEAAQVSGMTYAQVMRHVVMPQAARVILPPFVSIYIRITKESSVAALIGYVELTQTGLLIRESTGGGLAILGVVAIIYFILNYTISLIGGALERRITVADQEPLGAHR